MIQISLIEEFQVFASRQNLSKAARELNMTQSALSKHMATLERETGLNLLNHNQTNVSLTPTGKHFLRETAGMLAVWQNILQSCKEIQKEAEKDFVVQQLLEGNAVNVLLYELGIAYKKLHPTLEFSYIRLQGQFPQEALITGKLDVATDMRCGSVDEYCDEMSGRGLFALPLRTDSLVVWFRSDGAFSKTAEETPPTLEAFKHLPILMNVSENYDYIREALKALFQEHDMSPAFKPVHFESNSPAAFFLSDFEQSDVLLTSPGMIEDPSLRMRKDLSYRVIEDPRMQITTYLLVSKNNARALDFLDFAEGTIDSVPTP